MLPVVVVDVGGDRLDPDHTRKLVAHELSVDAVAPDDPRAAEATGRVDVVTKDGKLTVRYRKVDGPIERSIPVASDPARAEIDAAYLAGNLARDEASELARPTGDEEPARPAPPVAVVQENEDARDLAQMRAFLTQTADEQKSGRRRAGWAEIGASVAFIAPAVYLWTVEDTSSEASFFRLSATTAGASLLGLGILSVATASSDLDPLAQRLREHEKKGTPPAEAMADVEKEWAKGASAARYGRLAIGYISVVSGALSVATGGTMLAVDPSGEYGSSFPAPLISNGFFMILLGAFTLIDESGIESSHRLWKTVRGSTNGGPKVSFGASPLPGGGAASLTVRF